MKKKLNKKKVVIVIIISALVIAMILYFILKNSNKTTENKEISNLQISDLGENIDNSNNNVINVSENEQQIEEDRNCLGMAERYS